MQDNQDVGSSSGRFGQHHDKSGGCFALRQDSAFPILHVRKPKKKTRNTRAYASNKQKGNSRRNVPSVQKNCRFSINAWFLKNIGHERDFVVMTFTQKKTPLAQKEQDGITV